MILYLNHSIAIILLLTFLHLIASKESPLKILRHDDDSDSSYSLSPFPHFISSSLLRSNKRLLPPKGVDSSIFPSSTDSLDYLQLSSQEEEKPRIDSFIENATSLTEEKITNSTDSPILSELSSSEVYTEYFTSDEITSYKGLNASEYFEYSSSEGPSKADVSTEMEEVVLGTRRTPTSIPLGKSIYQKTIEWMEDAYTMSIVLPIAAGVLFACTIIITIAVCRCINRCCRRRRYRKKVLPDTVKHMMPSDRARLLADTSDEEF